MKKFYAKIKKTKSKNVFKLICLLTVLWLSIFIFLNKDNILHSELTFAFFKDKFVLPKSNSGFPVKISGENIKVQNFKIINGNIILTSNTSYMCINRKGNILENSLHSCYNPVLKTCADKVIFYDLNGNDIQIRFKSEILEKTKSEDKLLSAAVSGGNIYATITLTKLEETHLKIFKLFCKEPIYKKEMSNEHAVEVVLNKSGTTVAVVGNVESTEEKNNTDSNIRIIDIKKAKEKYCVVSKNNKLFYIDYISKNNVLCIGNKALLIVDTESGRFKEHRFSEKNVTAFAFSEDNGFCVANSSCETGNNCNILIFNKNGELKKIIKTNSAITALSYDYDSIAALSNGILNVYNLSGKSKGKTECKEDAKNIKLVSNNQVLIMTQTQIVKKSIIR